MRDYSRNLPMALLRAREAVMARFRPLLREHGLTEQQWRIIRALSDTGREVSWGATALSEVTLISAPSLTRTLRTMEEGGLVARTDVEGDSRRRDIRLTARGRALFDAIAPQSEARYTELEAQIGEGALERLYGLLGKLEE